MLARRSVNTMVLQRPGKPQTTSPKRSARNANRAIRIATIIPYLVGIDKHQRIGSKYVYANRAIRIATIIPYLVGIDKHQRIGSKYVFVSFFVSICFLSKEGFAHLMDSS